MKSKLVIAVMINKERELKAVDTLLNVPGGLFHFLPLLLLGKMKPFLQPLNKKAR